LNTRFFTEILEKIGAALWLAVMASGGVTDVDQAQAFAELLSRTVQTSINMGSGFQFAAMDDQGDSVRVALAALAAPLVAEQYVQSKAMPAELDLTKIVAVFESVLTFADNFKPSEANAQRLADLQAEGQVVDTVQMELQYIQAFVPVVQAVSGFSFGQSDKKLALDIADRLVKRSVEFRELQCPAVQDIDEQKRAELVIVKAMVQLYVLCHQEVVERLSSMTDTADPLPGLDEVWAQFDLRASMLDVMMQGILSVSPQGEAQMSALTSSSFEVSEDSVESLKGAPSSSPAPSIEGGEVTKDSDEVPAIFGVQIPEESAAVSENADAVIEDSFVQNSIPQDPVEPETKNETVNPMAIFATPKIEDSAPASVADSEEVVSEGKVDGDNGDEDKSGENVNPMSFFKTEQ